MHVVVMGCGRVGASIAQELQGSGHDVSIIDRDAAAFRRLPEDFGGIKVKGVGFDQEVLRRAGTAEADAFAAVSSGDNSNIIAARVARETFNVPKVVARIYDAKRAAVYERLGIPTVATVPWTTDRFISALGSGSADDIVWTEPSGEVAIVQLTVHESWVGTSVTLFLGRVVATSATLFQTAVGELGIPSPALALMGRVVSGTADQRNSACQQQTNQYYTYSVKLLHLLPPSN